ncbi:OmpA family protein [Roseateles sp. DC23W]|uniref:OmpA family protein n=1 Tax=Pelomonas dachongensis TaxID=3299029 RepID=A0ABW7ENZ8_9BURK
MSTTRFAASFTTLAAAAALMVGCASAPTVTPGLQQARSNVRAAEADPAVLKYASLDVKKAADSLQRAERLSAEREAPADIDSAAYIASTQARTAMAIAKAATEEEAIKAAEADRERARADANARRANVAQAQAANAQIAAANASADANAARQQAANAQADAAQAQAQAAALAQELADLQAKQTDRGMLVTLGDVLFEFGRAEIKPNAQASISKLANYLKQHPDRRVLIEGFTDSVGGDAANLTLSQRRSQAVAAALQAQGVDASRLETRGYGKQYPVASNSSTSDRAMNRRVEVYISNDNQPVRARG